MIARCTNIAAALRSRRRQRGFIINPYVFGSAGNDPNFASVQLLLHCDGSDTSTTFTDSSSAARTVTANGGAQLDTSVKKFGTASGQFTTTGDYVSIPNAASLHPGLGDYTIEWWAYPTVGGTEKFMFVLGVNEANGFIIGCSTAEIRFRDNGATDLVATQAINDGDHIACVRASGQKKIFINGTQVGGNQASSSNVNYGVTPFELGSPTSIGAGFRFTGRIDDFRYTVGVARYTGSFTPPAAAFPDA